MRATWTSRFAGIALTAVVVVAAGIATAAQAPDPLVGTLEAGFGKVDLQVRADAQERDRCHRSGGQRDQGRH